MRGPTVGHVCLGEKKMNKQIVARMIAILYSRGYTHHLRLFNMVEELFPDHGLDAATIRRMIHLIKTV